MKTVYDLNPEELIDLIKSIPGWDSYLYKDGDSYVATSGWLVGWFSERYFEGDTLENAVEQLINYFFEHLNYPTTIVGNELIKSGFPDLKKVKTYLNS